MVNLLNNGQKVKLVAFNKLMQKELQNNKESTLRTANL